jgi:hypothetical protein
VREPGGTGSKGVILSNKDVEVSGSQSAAAAVFVAEIASKATNGQAEISGQTGYWHNFSSQNTGNKLYKNA